MKKTTKGRLFLVSSVISLLVLLSISTAHGILKPGEVFGPSLKTEESAEATLSRTMKSQVALSSNPRQVLELTPPASELEPATAQTCGLLHSGLNDELDPYKGPTDCTDQGPVTISENFYNIFTWSGGRVSWWTGWTYGTVQNEHDFQHTCPNPPIVITANRPMSYWRQSAGCFYDKLITFTANTGQVIQKMCGYNQPPADAEFIGSGITSITMTSSPNTGFTPGVVHFIPEQACECPNIPVVP